MRSQHLEEVIGKEDGPIHRCHMDQIHIFKPRIHKLFCYILPFENEQSEKKHL